MRPDNRIYCTLTEIRNKQKEALTHSNRIKIALALLCVGLIGLGIILLFMLRREDVVDELSTYANRGALNNVSDIFLIPAIMFFSVIVMYAVSELYKTYKILNDPDTYRTSSTRRVGLDNERRVTLERSKRRRKPVAKRRRAAQRESEQPNSQPNSQPARQLTDQSKDRSVGLSANQITKPSAKKTETHRR